MFSLQQPHEHPSHSLISSRWSSITKLESLQLNNLPEALISFHSRVCARYMSGFIIPVLVLDESYSKPFISDNSNSSNARTHFRVASSAIWQCNATQPHTHSARAVAPALFGASSCHIRRATDCHDFGIRVFLWPTRPDFGCHSKQRQTSGR